MPKLILTIIQAFALLVVAAGVAMWSVPAALIIIGVAVIVSCEIKGRT